MSCNLSKGRYEPCKQYQGGLYKVWFANFDSLSGCTVDSDTNIIKDLGQASGTELYEYQLKGNSNLTQEMVSNRDNGTTMVTQTLTLNLKGADYESNNQIKLLAYGRPHIIVQDNYGSAWLCGKVRGVELTTSTLETGAAMGDKYGYNITLVAEEYEYANFLSGSTISNVWGGLDSKPTVCSTYINS